VCNRPVLLATKAERGSAVGSTVDAERCAWHAWAIGDILEPYLHVSSVERRISMTTSNVTTMIFDGDTLDRVYISSLDEVYASSMAGVAHPGTDTRG
jgi:sugar lactone lactonase YvrE